jgi:hypothetical protein
MFSLIVVAILSDSNTESIGFNDKLIVGGTFISSAVFGISCALKPNWLKRTINRKRGIMDQKQNLKYKIEYRGHHPACEHFRNHTIRFKDKTKCAGCTGLAFGSIISIVLMSFYVLSQTKIPSIVSYLFILLGFILIATNYIEMSILMRNGSVHLIFNFLFVVGLFFVVIGVFEGSSSIIYGILGVIISILFLDSRIQLSNWHHVEVCNNCRLQCGAY